MKKTLALVAFAAALPVRAASKTEDRKLGEFEAVEVSGGMRAEIVLGPAQRVMVEGDADAVGLVVTEVKGKTLQVHWAPQMAVFTNHAAVVRIAVSALEAVRTSGGAQVQVTGWTGDRAALEASGGSSIEVSGRGKEITAEASGGSRIIARGLVAGRGSAAASGGGRIEVCVNGELAATASGGSRIGLACRPKTLTKSMSGGARIESL